MSNEESAKQAVESSKKIAGNAASALMDLKEKNPKVFFGAIGGVVVLILIMMMSGGGGNKPAISGPSIKNLAIGQQYILKSPNSYDPASTVRLVSVPGALAAYDDSEEADRTGACQHMAQGTKVTPTEFQDFAGKKNIYVKVKMLEGECKDNEGWTLAINVQ